MKNIVILYHADCPDGFGAAWAAWKKLGRSATYIPVTHQNPPPKGLVNKEIYMLDFTYDKPVIEKLISTNKSVTSIDHHESHKAVTKLTEKYLYDVKRSGAVLSWMYFNSRKPVPRLLRYIEDGDLWKWRVPDSRKISTAIYFVRRDFMSWDKLNKNIESKSYRRNLARNGELILDYNDMLIKKMIRSAEKVKFAGEAVYAINAPRYFADDLGNMLSKKLPPFAAIWREENGRINVSLRGSGGIDVSKIAAKFGGGGRKVAAAFSFPAGRKLPWKIIKK